MSVSDIFGFDAPFVEILYRTALVYLAVLVGMRSPAHASSDR